MTTPLRLFPATYLLISTMLFCLLNAPLAKAQDTLYFDPQYEQLSSPAKARYYEIRNFDEADANRCAVRVFYADSNNLISLRRYSDYQKGIYHGKCIDWYKNGTISREGKYNNGLMQGEDKAYFPNGQLKRKVVWDADTIVSGTFFNEDGTPKTEIFKEDVEEALGRWQISPVFPGGEVAMFRYLSSSINYPDGAKEDNIQGVVLVEFVVGTNGDIINVAVLSPPQRFIDKEALRVIKKCHDGARLL